MPATVTLVGYCKDAPAPYGLIKTDQGWKHPNYPGLLVVGKVGRYRVRRTIFAPGEDASQNISWHSYYTLCMANTAIVKGTVAFIDPNAPRAVQMQQIADQRFQVEND